MQMQLCTVDPVNRAENQFTVTVHSPDGNKAAIFDCDSERNAVLLRNAIRDYATQLRRVFDYSK